MKGRSVPILFEVCYKSMVARIPAFSARSVARALLVLGLVVQLVFVSTSPSDAIPDADDSLLELNSETLKKFVTSRGTTVVEFYQPWYTMPLVPRLQFRVHFASHAAFFPVQVWYVSPPSTLNQATCRNIQVPNRFRPYQCIRLSHCGSALPAARISCLRRVHRTRQPHVLANSQDFQQFAV